MKILMLTSEYPPLGSGIASVCKIIYDSLSEEGFKIDILSRYGVGIKNSTYISQLPGISGLIPFFEDSLSYYINKASEYDLIWMHSPISLSSDKLLHIKKGIITFHTSYHGYYTAYKNNRILGNLTYYSLANKIENNFLRNLSKNKNKLECTAVSPLVAKELMENGLSLPVNIIPNGFSEFDHKINKISAREIINNIFSTDLKKTDYVLLSLGRLNNQKRSQQLMKIVNNVVSSNDFLKLLVVGRGELLSTLKNLSRNHPNLHVLGYVEKEFLPHLYAASNSLISLSCYEGFPLTVLDAISYSLPVILSDIPVHRWLLESDFAEGCLINPKNITQCVEDVNSFINLDRKKQSIYQNKNSSCLRWNNIIKEYLKLVKGLS